MDILFPFSGILLLLRVVVLMFIVCAIIHFGTLYLRKRFGKIEDGDDSALRSEDG